MRRIEQAGRRGKGPRAKASHAGTTDLSKRGVPWGTKKSTETSRQMSPEMLKTPREHTISYNKRNPHASLNLQKRNLHATPIKLGAPLNSPGKGEPTQSHLPRPDRVQSEDRQNALTLLRAALPANHAAETRLTGLKRNHASRVKPTVALAASKTPSARGRNLKQELINCHGQGNSHTAEKTSSKNRQTWADHALNRIGESVKAKLRNPDGQTPGSSSRSALATAQLSHQPKKQHLHLLKKRVVARGS